MIFSIDKSFIFVHVPKTGGTTVSNWLKPYAVSPTRIALSKLGMPMSSKKHNLRALPISLAGKHVSLRSIADTVGVAGISDKYIFSFVRNPYDREVSLFLYMKNNKAHYQHKIVRSLHFSEYLAWRLQDDNVDTQESYVQPLSQCIGAHVYKFEQFSLAIVDIASKLSRVS